jgi:thymidylate kinase
LVDIFKEFIQKSAKVCFSQEPEGFHGQRYGKDIYKQVHEQLRDCLEAFLHLTTEAEACKKVISYRNWV